MTAIHPSNRRSFAKRAAPKGESVSYSDDWLKAVRTKRQQPTSNEPEPDNRFAEDWRTALGRAKSRPMPVEPWPVTVHPLEDPPPCGGHSTTWKPWAQMTAEERRKALAQRDGK